MMGVLLLWLGQRRKSIVAAVVSLLVALAAARGVDMDADSVAVVTAMLTSLSVWAVPNNG